jgi:hypothetical protein
MLFGGYIVVGLIMLFVNNAHLKRPVIKLVFVTQKNGEAVSETAAKNSAA